MLFTPSLRALCVYATDDFRYTNGDAPFASVDGEPQPRAVLETYAGTLAYGVDGTANSIDMCW